MGIVSKGPLREKIVSQVEFDGTPQTVRLARAGEEGEKEILTVECSGDGEIEDVTFNCGSGNTSVSLHADEVIVQEAGERGEARDIRFYKLDEAGGVDHAARLYTDAASGLVRTSVVDGALREADRGLIDSARQCFASALEHPEEFSLRPLFSDEDATVDV